MNEHPPQVPADCCCPVFQPEGAGRRVTFLACCPTHAPDAPPAVAPRVAHVRRLSAVR